MENFPIGAAATLAELERDPHPLLARLRAGEPVSWLPALRCWLVTRYDLALRVLRDPETFTVDDPRFSTARVVGPSMLSLDGAEHARHREPFAPAFRPAEVRTHLVAFTEAECDRLLSALRPAGGADLRRDFAGPLAVAVVAKALGLTGIDAATVLSWYAAIVDAVTEVTAGRPVPPAGVCAFADLRAAVEETIATHPATLLAHAANRLPAREVASNAAVLMFGAIDTTDGMITNAARHLLAHPEALADPTRLPDAVEESLRLEPSAAVVDRYATRDITLAGTTIRRGDPVTVSIAAANRDPDVYPDPDRFDPHRTNSRPHLAFAQGPHFCLGAHLARTETTIALRRLLDLPPLRLDPAHPNTPRGLIFRKPPALHVLW